MKKWEYLTLSARWFGSPVELRNNRAVPGCDAGTPIGECLSALGDQGWELVSEWLDPNVSGGAVWNYHWDWVNSDWGKAGKVSAGELLESRGKERWELVAAAPETISRLVANRQTYDEDAQTSYTKESVMRGSWLLLFRRPNDEAQVNFRFKRPKE